MNVFAKRTITSLGVVLLLSIPQIALASDLSVSATIPARASDFSTVITKDTSDNSAQAGQEIKYTITYGSSLSSSTPLSLKASWSRGTPALGSNASIDIADYVINSATQGLGDTSPTIDLTNQTITWSFSSFPALTSNQQVSFRLKVPASFAAATNVTFNVKSLIVGPGVTTDPSSIQMLYTVPVTQTTPTPTPNPTSIPTSTPTPAVIKQSFNNITTRLITTEKATFSIELTVPSSLTIYYGLSPSGLTQSIADKVVSKFHTITLNELNPNTTYYLQASTGTLTSDILTIKTAVTIDIPLPDLPSLLITSGNQVLNSSLTTQGQPSSQSAKQIIIPAQTIYDFRISFSLTANIKRVEAILRNKFILGIASFPKVAEASDNAVEMIEITPGIFSGRLKTPATPGTYELFLRVTDTGGNIIEHKGSTIRVDPPFRVLNKRTKAPIEDALVRLYYRDAKTKSFKLIQPESISIKNPSFSNADGVVTLILPSGSYKAEVSNVSFKPETIFFSIGEKESDSYPTVLMQEQPFNLLNTANYFFKSFTDVFLAQTSEYLSSLSVSKRMVHLTQLLILLSSGTITLLAFVIRSQFPLFSLPAYFLHKIKSLSNNHLSDTISGMITSSENDQEIKGVNIYVANIETHQLLAHTISNRLGKFTMSNLPEGIYRISFLKAGYQSFIIEERFPYPAEKLLSIALSSHPKGVSLKEKIALFFQQALSVSFEALLLFSCLMVLLIGLNLGWTEIRLFVALALFNTIIWLLHQRSSHIVLKN